MGESKSPALHFGLLYVTVVGGYDQAVSLRFNHRMAKVEFTLMAGAVSYTHLDVYKRQTSWRMGFK